ncbi:hypothetical protein [Ferruginibacter sp.]|nr:hypothetical protein [Ferruginibacter sp.]
MRKVTSLFISLSISLAIFGQTGSEELQRDVAFYNAVNKWFSAWKLVSKDIYKINQVRPVEFVFFDKKYVYSTSSITIRNGISVKGCNLINLNLKWKKALHNDTLTFPDKSVVPINLMSFAAQIPGDSNKSFFVMPLPGFWAESGVTSKELGLENLITGIFLHEFSHSQQMRNFGKKITVFEQQNNWGVEFNDDVVQNIFSKDTVYCEYNKKEIGLFYNSIKSNVLNKGLVTAGLGMLKKRQNEYFTGRYKNLEQIDNFFLTMEGIGQYSMYLWLIHSKGGNIKREIAIEGVRRGGRWWSQDEGFVLFLILEKLKTSKSWAKDMFGNKTEDVIVLIEDLVK